MECLLEVIHEDFVKEKSLVGTQVNEYGTKAKPPDRPSRKSLG